VLPGVEGAAARRRWWVRGCRWLLRQVRRVLVGGLGFGFADAVRSDVRGMSTSYAPARQVPAPPHPRYAALLCASPAHPTVTPPRPIRSHTTTPNQTSENTSSQGNEPSLQPVLLSTSPLAPT